MGRRRITIVNYDGGLYVEGVGRSVSESLVVVMICCSVYHVRVCRIRNIG